MIRLTRACRKRLTPQSGEVLRALGHSLSDVERREQVLASVHSSIAGFVFPRLSCSMANGRTVFARLSGAVRG